MEIGNEQIGSIPDLVENNPDRRGLMGDDVNESSDSSLSSALSTSSTRSSDEETDSEQTPLQNMLPARMSIMTIREKTMVTLMIESQPR